MNTNNLDDKSSKQPNSTTKLKETYEDVSENSSKENYDRYRNGRWQPTEHLRFIKGCLLYGNNWKKVKEFVKTRSSAQIRSHAQKYIIKLCKKFGVQDNKHLKNLKNLKKTPNVISDVMKDIGETMNIPEDLNNLDMDQIEETILGIFKSNGEKKNTDSLSKLNNIDDDDCYSDDKKKVFETVKEPKNNKKSKKSNEDDNEINLWNNQSEELINGLLSGKTYDNSFILNLLRNKNNNVIGTNILQNIIGNDYNTPLLGTNFFNLPQMKIGIPNIIQSNPQSNHSSTNLQTVEDENSMNNLSKLQNLQNIADIWKILNENNQAGDIINDHIPKTEITSDPNFIQALSLKMLQDMVNKQPLPNFNSFDVLSPNKLNQNLNMPMFNDQLMRMFGQTLQNNMPMYMGMNPVEIYLNNVKNLLNIYDPNVKREDNK